ncbi:MAG: HDOD domain-containing protein [Planctomycetia bacterium]|nr:HDOD domain-containing protein [Planctomycetia bacterium]
MSVTLSAIDRMIGQIDRLHSVPAVAQKILGLIREPDFNLAEVAACLEHDPALSARVLGLVNSSRYSPASRVTSIRQAAALLGQRTLKLVTLSFSLIDAFSRGAHRQLFQDYWKRALTTATVAQRLAVRTKQSCRDEAYSAGLVADLGILALAHALGEHYVQLYSQFVHGPELVAAEVGAIGFDHAELGARLLERWGLPAQVISAVAGHHRPAADCDPMITVVHAGWLMSEALWTPNSPHVSAARDFLNERCGVGLDDFIELALACRNDINESADAFGISLSEQVNSEQLIDEARRLSFAAAFDATSELDSLADVAATTSSTTSLPDAV